MRSLDASINVDDEVKAIAAFIALKWSSIKNLEQLVQEIRLRAEHIARALFDEHDVFESLADAMDKRESTLKTAHKDSLVSVHYYDAGWNFFDTCRSQIGVVRKAALNSVAEWDYERHVGETLRSLTSSYPDLVGARPNGWAELAKGYNDFDGQEEYEPQSDKDQFQGVKVASVSSGDFVSRTALPYIIYDEIGHGRKAHYTLVGAIFSQFALIAEYVNTQKVRLEIEAIAAELPQELCFELRIQPKNPVLKALAHSDTSRPSKQNYEAAIEHVKAYHALSEAEKAIKDAEYDASNKAFMAKLLKPVAPLSYDAIQAQEKLKSAPFIQILNTAFVELLTDGALATAAQVDDMNSAASDRERMRS